MSDLIERLRRGFGGIVPRVCDEAANEIESLQSRLGRGKNRLLNLVAELEQRERGTTHWEGCAETHWPCRVIESVLAAVNELEPVVERPAPICDSAYLVHGVNRVACSLPVGHEGRHDGRDEYDRRWNWSE